MDFKKFANSAFLHVGYTRFDYSSSSKNFLQYESATYDTGPFYSFNASELAVYNSAFKNMPLSRSRKLLTLCHLSKLLLIHDPDFLELDFKQEIIRQWAEVTDALRLLNASPKISQLLIMQPGQTVAKHSHMFQHTISFCYTFCQDSTNTFERSHIIAGNGFDKIIPLPNDPCYFMFYDGLPHGAKSNEWRFFWFNDFAEYVDISVKMPFTFVQI